ncbi:hypothetical protein A3K93_08910 [Acinetobacter sp. NCu2D-2]|uniref:hypothetical protein n=1 Tax=Acinetobacter sp. NCu2D-2 TaxID=1608473 RepID=UPI0007CDB76F|nr:hypothetical protein [Acinetobacter sp. NCu2D-2]ANF82302.1 hypothetical protein A3K93_08910 [Acinetobacter sp. NCu2D-2]
MIIDFKQAQLAKFLAIAKKIQNQPELYLNFDHVSDFYKASWLEDFPQGTIWHVSGLDDGAEVFYISIQYTHYRLNIDCGETCSVSLIAID